MTTKELLTEASQKLYEGYHALAKIYDNPDYDAEKHAVPLTLLGTLITGQESPGRYGEVMGMTTRR